jgi:hypothetical protein
MKPKWLSSLQWLYRSLVIVSTIISAYILIALPYNVLPKQLYYSLGIWFFWYSVPAFVGLYILLAVLWLVLRKRYSLTSFIPITDLGVLIAYVIFYVVMQARV